MAESVRQTGSPGATASIRVRAFRLVGDDAILVVVVTIDEQAILGADASRIEGEQGRENCYPQQIVGAVTPYTSHSEELRVVGE